MSTIPIRHILALRRGTSDRTIDRTICDYLDLMVLAPTPGALPVAMLRERWRCSQSMVSRRMAAVSAAGLADITSSWGAYQVHGVSQLEVPA